MKTTMEPVASLNSNPNTTLAVTDKSSTLSALQGITQHSIISDQVNFNYWDWLNSRSSCLKQINKVFVDCFLIVRSSHSSEDQEHQSAAGQFFTAKKINSNSVDSLIKAVDQVFNSYPDDASKNQQKIFIQKYLDDFKIVGVIMTKSLTSGAPYDQINFHDNTSDSSAVTAGKLSGLKHHTSFNGVDASAMKLPAAIATIKNAARELESILRCNGLDIEFALDDAGDCHVFQVRKLVQTKKSRDINDNILAAKLGQIANTINAASKHQDVLGDAPIYGVMPDWNPAEIIGSKPNPLALSIYHFILLDSTWAEQRFTCGYRDLRGHSLLRSFAGCPYIDVRLSFNSLVPSKLENTVAERIVNAYLLHLKGNPELHDKIEFDVVLSAMTPAFLSKAKTNLIPYGVRETDLLALATELKQITAEVLTGFHKLADSSKCSSKRTAIMNSELSDLNCSLLLLESAKKTAALVFAHAARAAFIAINLLKDMVAVGILKQHEYEQFIHSVSTITSEFKHDIQTKNQAELVAKYGHLRPGTYDIKSEAYWEKPEFYLSPKTAGMNGIQSASSTFVISDQSSRSMAEWLCKTFKGTVADGITVDYFLSFCRAAIQKRELLKFDLSKDISSALDGIISWGHANGIDRDSLSHFTVDDLFESAKQPNSFDELKNMGKRRLKSKLTELIELPQLITSVKDLYAFSNQATTANFITTKTVTAALINNWYEPQDLSGSVVLLEQADPGFDWLFNHDILGIITAYGGANSHMAIRTAELNIAACIGVGQKTYQLLKGYDAIVMNCEAKLLTPVS